MFQNLIKAFKIKEVRNKIFITLLLLLVYRIGCYVPVPGWAATCCSRKEAITRSFS